MTRWHSEANPLLEGIDDVDSPLEFSKKLRFDPVARGEGASFPFSKKLEFLTGEVLTLSPTIALLELAMLIWSLIRQSYRMRNPVLASGRKLVEDIVSWARTVGDFSDIPMKTGASVIVVKGITGLGKTRTIKRLMILLSPQVVVHSKNDTARWVKATQVRYLYVQLSHDGSRGGLLTAILVALDKAVHGTYSVDLPKKYRTIDKLIPSMVELLHDYYLGVLIIDEVQYLSLVESDHATLMHLLLLNLSNSGIPIVLMGNPPGFSAMADLAQFSSRILNSTYLHPCGAIDDDNVENWERVFEGIVRYYFLPESLSSESDFSFTLKLRSGGIPKCALELWCAAQRGALFRGRDGISVADLDRVYFSGAFAEIRPLCEGFAEKDPIKLMRWSERGDVPVDFYASAWNKTLPTAAEGGKPQALGLLPTSPKPTKRTVRSGLSRLKAIETRERNEDHRRRALKESLPPDDLRIAGLKKFHLAGLHDLMKKVTDSGR